MSLENEGAKAEKGLAFLFELELGYRLDGKTWTQDATYTACYWVDHSTEGEPSRVRELLLSSETETDYGTTPAASLAACNTTAGSWYYDSSTGRLYVHTTTGADPGSGTFYICSHFYRYFCDDQQAGDKEIVFNGQWYEPRLDRDSVSDVEIEVSDFSEGGVSRSWGSVTILNADGAYDAELAKYIWTGCYCRILAGVPGEAYANFAVLFPGKTGTIDWDDEKFDIAIDDWMDADEEGS